MSPNAPTAAASNEAPTQQQAVTVLKRPAAPPPSARSRWKKLTGTAMFINRLGKMPTYGMTKWPSLLLSRASILTAKALLEFLNLPYLI